MAKEPPDDEEGDEAEDEAELDVPDGEGGEGGRARLRPYALPRPCAATEVAARAVMTAPRIRTR